jgi:two-component system response regulator
MELQLDVLLVDDNHVDLAFFERAANKTRLNIRLQTLTSALRAREYLEGQEQYKDRLKFPWPHVVVIDLQMPQVSGLDFLAWRQASTVFCSVPVVVLSGSFGPALVKEMDRLGANKVLVKPTDLHDWEKIVREIWELGITSKDSFQAKQDGGDAAK